MKTREPILTRGRDHWDAVNLPEGEFHERIGRVRDAMEADGLDALLLYGTGDRDGDIAYLSNLVHKVPGFPLALVVTREMVVVLNQRSSRTRPIVERNTWVDDIRFTRDLWSAFDEVLAELTGSGAEVGFVGSDALAYPDHQALDALGSSRSVDLRDGYLDPIRRTKSGRELDQIRRSGRLLGSVAQFLSEDVVEPITERRLEARLDRFARLNGAQDVRVLISNPDQVEDALRPPEALPVTGEEPVSLYLATRFEGYWSALARTETLGDTTPAAEGIDDLSSVYEDLLESLGPGQDATALLGSARDQLADRGFELDARYGLLSGIGLELDEPPTVDDAADRPAVELEPGTAAEFVLPARKPGGPTMVVGDTAVLTDEGVEVVTR